MIPVWFLGVPRIPIVPFGKDGAVYETKINTAFYDSLFQPWVKSTQPKIIPNTPGVY